MAKEICISTTPHETRLAIIEDEQLAEIYYERENEYTLAGSIYKGRVTRVLPGMQSSFVDVGLERDAFLYVTDFLEEQEDSDEYAAEGEGGGRREARVRSMETEEPSAAVERVERGGERNADRGGERNADRGSERNADRGGERNAGERPRRPAVAAAQPAEPAREGGRAGRERAREQAVAPLREAVPAVEDLEDKGDEESPTGTRRWRGRRGRRRGVRGGLSEAGSPEASRTESQGQSSAADVEDELGAASYPTPERGAPGGIAELRASSGVGEHVAGEHVAEANLAEVQSQPAQVELPGNAGRAGSRDAGRDRAGRRTREPYAQASTLDRGERPGRRAEHEPGPLSPAAAQAAASTAAPAAASTAVPAASSAASLSSAPAAIVLPGESLSKYGSVPAEGGTGAQATATVPRPAARPVNYVAAKPSTLVELSGSWDGGAVMPGESLSRYRGLEPSPILSGRTAAAGEQSDEQRGASQQLPAAVNLPVPEPFAEAPGEAHAEPIETLAQDIEVVGIGLPAEAGLDQIDAPARDEGAAERTQDPEPSSFPLAEPEIVAESIHATPEPPHVSGPVIEQTHEARAPEAAPQSTEYEPENASASYRVNTPGASELRIAGAEEQAPPALESEEHGRFESGAHSPAEPQAQQTNDSEAQHTTEPEAQYPAKPEAQHTAEPEAQHPAEPEAQHPAEPGAHQPAEPEAQHPAEAEAQVEPAIALAEPVGQFADAPTPPYAAGATAYEAQQPVLALEGEFAPLQASAGTDQPVVSKEPASVHELTVLDDSGDLQTLPIESQHSLSSEDVDAGAPSAHPVAEPPEAHGFESTGEDAVASAQDAEQPHAERISEFSRMVDRLQGFAPGQGLLEEETIDEEEYDFEPVDAHAEEHDQEDLEEETLDHDMEPAVLSDAVRDSYLEQRVHDTPQALSGEDVHESDEVEEGRFGFVEIDEEEDEPEDSAAPSEVGGEAQRSSRGDDRGRGRGGRSGGGRNAGGRRGGPGRGRSAQTQDLPIITDLLKQGQEILVQIAKEPMAKKGARITSHIALPGRFLVFMPTVSHVGVSRKIASDEERQRLKRILIHEKGESSGGFIVRTAAENASEEDLRADLRFLISLWTEIKQRSEAGKAPALIYHDLNLIERILRDQVSSNFSTIWVDSEAEYERIIRFLNRFQPQLVRRVKLYTKETPLFEHFGIQEEISKALKSKVWLKSGGSIVINQTEALVAIDINTGKYVGKTARLEDTIVKTNLDAIPEIVRQIRLRDLGGIIVIDFIDMDERKNRNRVLAALEEELKHDRAPSKVLQFNDFGLVAITRKRVKQSLERTLSVQCEVCTGTGMVKSPITVCNEIYIEMRKMIKHLDGKDVMLRVHPEVVKQLKAGNGKWINELEEMVGKTMIIKSDPALHPEQFDIH